MIREFHRFEGVSDPDHMSIVYAIEGQGGVRGTLVDAFGAYSDPRVSAFLDGVPEATGTASWCRSCRIRGTTKAAKADRCRDPRETMLIRLTSLGRSD